jgi:DNA processing protein
MVKVGRTAVHFATPATITTNIPLKTTTTLKNQMDSLIHQIALTLMPQIGPVTAKTLVSYCGSAEAVFRASRKELLKIPGIGAAAIAYLHAPEVMQLAEKELAFLEAHEVQAIFYTHPKYPARMLQCGDAPALFYFKGSSLDLLHAERIVAVVGTRQPTEHGKNFCEEFVEGLAPFNVTFVSGLAYGIDIAAHRKSCALNLPNIGVLGHGLASIYPSQHRSTALKMIENGGLISEYVHDAKPDREHFPMRNRIIAGLCDALLVVETAASGGSMITANIASRCEREIFAVPGRPNDPKSAGCNYLIRTHQAHLVEVAADLAQVMRWDESGKPKTVQTRLLLDLDPVEKRLVDIIRAQPDIAIDQLAITSGLSPGLLASHILALEFMGAIKTLPGKRYVVVG